MINMALVEQIEARQGLRPHAEISNLIKESIDVKTINPNKAWHRLDKLDKGSYGEVYKMKRRSDNKIFAMKQIRNVDAENLALTITEASLQAYLGGDELVKCVDLYYFKRTVFIMMEYMDQGSLADIVRNHDSYSEDFCRYSLYKVALGLLKMHRKNVLHRDIKSDNILHSEDGEIKIADLGCSCFLSAKQEFRKTQRGTLNWFAPEIAQGIKYSKEVDVWAFGCFAYELATGKPPFSGIHDRRELFHNIMNVDIPEIHGAWSDDFKDFVRVCLKRDPNERWTVERLLFEHPFLVGLDVDICK